MLLKQKSPSLPRNWVLGTFVGLLIMFSTKVNLLYILYSDEPEVLSSISNKESYVLDTFQRTLILMTLVSLYLFTLLEPI